MPTTHWSRIEPVVRDVDIAPSLQARVHDPLWLLARQWQLREFAGEDAGSPVRADLRVETAGLRRDGAPLASLPLDVHVEREPVDASGLLGRTIEAGLQLLRLLDAAGLGARYRERFVSGYALTPDASRLDSSGARALRLMSGRVPDGRAVQAELAGGAALPSKVAVDADDSEQLTDCMATFARWCGGLYSEPDGEASAWQADRMEYGFALTAALTDADLTLVAAEHASGELDWPAFDARLTARAGAPSGPAASVQERRLLPTRLAYPGMPAPRFWEFEDARVDFGGLEANPEDLARLLLVEFALVYGNDWFLVPLELPVATVCRVLSLVVADSFGVGTVIPSVAALDGPGSPWKAFALSPDPLAPDAAPATGVLLVAPTLIAPQRGTELESVALLRDEMANMAWAVERVVESVTGGALDRLEAQLSARAPQPPPTAAAGDDDALVYRLGTTVPDHWIPLLPRRLDAGGPSIGFAQGEIPDDGREAARKPWGRILAAQGDLLIPEEEIPREGAQVSRAFRHARWTDGSTHVWLGRRKTVGRGEGWSGLRFDVAEPPEQPPA
ncbi:MAG TPA: hypothetical protein VGO80_21885 [Solirubrobacteraceae bacterium]|nr:hypothetical protein [Solirubrobacteraceae bacterium]